MTLPKLSLAQTRLLVLFGQSHYHGYVSAGGQHKSTVRSLAEQGMLSVTYKDHNDQPTTYEAWIRAWKPRDPERRNFRLTAAAEAHLAAIGQPMIPIPLIREADRVTCGSAAPATVEETP